MASLLNLVHLNIIMRRRSAVHVPHASWLARRLRCDPASPFAIACELAGVAPTTRQASKFRRQTGAAYRALVQAGGARSAQTTAA